MKSNRPFLSCQHCDGSGLIPLDDKNYECLQIMQKLKSATVEAVHKLRKPGDGVTNCNNLLEDLRQLGFVTRSEKRVGRKWVYSIIQ